MEKGNARPFQKTPYQTFTLLRRAFEFKQNLARCGYFYLFPPLALNPSG